MKVVTLVIGLVLVIGFNAPAQAQDIEPLRMHDAHWIRDAGDRLARCAGIYRGAAAVMRDGGRVAGAAYAESVASGALFAAYLLLTSPEAVAATVLHGIDAQRIRTIGLGEGYPVASNDTQAGMQQNRRVEIVISDEQGKFPAGTERTATAR